MRHPSGSILILSLLLALLSACTDKPPPAGPRSPVSLSMGKVLVDLPVGHKAGSYDWGWGCNEPYNDVAWITEGRIPGLLTQAAKDGIGWGGLGLTEGAGRRLTGRLIDVDLSLCRKLDPFTDKPIGDTGDGTVRVDWEVTDPPGPVRRFTTEGTGETDIPALNGRYDVILRNAMADAARQLAALPDFRTLVTAAPAEVKAPGIAGLPAGPGTPPATHDPFTPAAASAPPPPDDGPEPTIDTPPAASLVRWAAVTGVIADATGLVLLPDTGADLPNPLPLMLADGRAVDAIPVARAYGCVLLRLPPGEWPALPVRRQRPGVSHWLHRVEGDGKPVAMVAAHTGPSRIQATEVPSLLLDLDEGLWRDPPWMLVDDDGRLAALRGSRVLPGDPAPYYAPAGVMAHFRAITDTREAP